MIEQPFPLNFLESDNLEKWKEVKSTFKELGVEIIADESVTTKEDVILLEPFATGVNVKIEKSAGIRGAVEALYQAEKLGMQKWVGIMIGSSLNSTQAAHVACLASKGVDLDGPLQIDPSSERFSCGFE
jgi:L-alanine-DL-glutamate epimerase-like enolase superfamily enzyme